jgi:hypothetical protein
MRDPEAHSRSRNRVVRPFSDFNGHGKEKGVVGTVTSISDTSITVETTAKKSVTVEVTNKTKFEKSSSPAALKDLGVRSKVVIHADASEEMKGVEGVDPK